MEIEWDASTGCEFLLIAFRGTYRNRLEAKEGGAIGRKFLENDPEMAMCISTPSLRLLRRMPHAYDVRSKIVLDEDRASAHGDTCQDLNCDRFEPI